MKAASRKHSAAKKILLRIVLSLLGLAALIGLAGMIAFKVVHVTNGEIVSSGQTREYLLYVPENLDPTVPAPLIISLHGFAEWPAHQRRISAWDDLADEYGFIVVYPSGRRFPLRWATISRAELPDAMAEDVAFIADLIDDLANRYAIDPDRIYANGLSNGGGMSVVLACELSDRIAAIGGVSGAYTYPLDACSPSHPIPLIAFHGTADEVVPYMGGPSRSFDLPFPAVPDTMVVWASMNGCNSKPVELPASGDVSGIQYTGCDRDADVVFYTIDGGGHAWPGGEPLPELIVGVTSDDIATTRVMWEFFQQHPFNG